MENKPSSSKLIEAVSSSNSSSICSSGLLLSSDPSALSKSSSTLGISNSTSSVSPNSSSFGISSGKPPPEF